MRGPAWLVAVGLFALGTGPLAAQEPAAAPTPPAAAPAPADVASVDAILGALYDVISGPPGPRNWDRMRSLFIPGARLIPTWVREGAPGYAVWTVDEYITRAGTYLEQNGFFEREIARSSQTFGQVTHAWSSYESRRTPEEAPFSRGINSIQLLHQGDRWWVVTIYWDSERPDNPIPAMYLPQQ